MRLGIYTMILSILPFVLARLASFLSPDLLSVLDSAYLSFIFVLLVLLSPIFFIIQIIKDIKSNRAVNFLLIILIVISLLCALGYLLLFLWEIASGSLYKVNVIPVLTVTLISLGTLIYFIKKRGLREMLKTDWAGVIVFIILYLSFLTLGIFLNG